MKELEVMSAIQTEKAKEITDQDLLELDAEGATVAEAKRLTFDVTTVDTDPLR